ncbi:hypothetical protein LZG74_19540 [Dyadobacter sp. CY327]|uniref:DUF6882 domain-containing protein n=1 Tax=Dyadobacter sp. CY327 TaxID=2907301 RepID=UPI001F20275C|nr:DUF6882 domain-containing protein [Dyadobacter sp. CY327]MCE7072520.1 hypothetical protein [Dyadobacter sp. CY327]
MEITDYNAFAGDCIDELKALQDQFKETFDIAQANWFYNQATGLLTFSTDDTELNFKYFQVGSFSSKSETWMWSWHNENTLENVKEPTSQIRDFGESFNFAKLTEGHFASDEFEAWEFTAISVKLIKGIGVYRPVNDEGLMIFLVITEFVDNETAKNIKNKYIECGDHEYRRVAFVCQHLNFDTKVGFEESFETIEGMELSDEDDFQAWCDECETIRVAEDGWSRNAMKFAKYRVVCEGCYFKMKTLNLGSD